MIEREVISFSPIWVSTIEHQEAFSRLVHEASLAKKILGSYNLPTDFPQVHMLWGIFPVFRVPLVMIASGRLTVLGKMLQFEALAWGKLDAIGGNVYKNLQSDLKFELSGRELSQIERYENPRPFMAYYNLSWTRVRSTRMGLLSDILLAVGGRGPTMGRIRKRNADLFSALNRLADRSQDR